MSALSPTRSRLSIGLLSLVAAVAVMTPAMARLAAAPSESPWYGRWTVNEERPVFTTRGRQYKTIDIAPCGRDFCGVSIGDNGACGANLFRFLARHADGSETLHGHGRWGTDRKNVQLINYSDSDQPSGSAIELWLGDGHDFGERSDNMPKFHANYRRLGEARCTGR